MRISHAGADDVPALARLIWVDTLAEEPTPQSVETFASELTVWWASRWESHLAFVARLAQQEIIGMAWVALLPRVPRPAATNRVSADIQTVYVLPEHRGAGIGSALVQVAADRALQLGAGRVTVHSGRKALPVYERLGFESSRRLLQRPPD